MKKVLFIIILTIVTGLAIAIQPKFAKDPAISPDGKMVCFAYMRDLWLVPFEGGVAKRLTATKGDEFAPIFSPDGKWIAYKSNKNGSSMIYKIPSDGGKAILICKESATPIDWFEDSERLLAISYVTGSSDAELFEVNANKITRPKSIGKIGDFFSVLSKDNKKIIFCRNGYANREKYKGSKNGELWEYDIEKKKYKRLTRTAYTERYPQTSKIDNSIYFIKSDGEIFQIFKAQNYDFKNAKQLTKFKKRSARDISIAVKNDRLVFERFDDLWKYDPKTGKSGKIEIEIKEDFLSDFMIDREYRNKFSDLDISKNGKLLVFSYKYDLFAMPEKGGKVKQITFDNQGIGSIAIMDDNETIFFTKRVKGAPKLFKTNIKNTQKIEMVSWSKDKYIEYLIKEPNNILEISFSEGEDRRQVAIMDSTSDIEIIVDEDLTWSVAINPTGEYGVYVKTTPGVWTHELILIDLKTDKKTSLVKYDNWVNRIHWAKDSKSLFYTTNGDIMRLDLIAKNDFYYSKDPWKDILGKKDSKNKKNKSKEKKKEKQKIKFDFDNIDIRDTKIVSHLGSNYVVNVANDSIIYYVNSHNNKHQYRKVNYLGKNGKLIKTYSSNKFENFLYSPTKKAYYCLANNMLTKLELMSGKTSLVKNKFRYKYRELNAKKAIYNQVWAEFGKNFYDKDMHGVDWEDAYDQFSPYMKYAYNNSIFGTIVDEMIGEVNASHTGFYPKDDSEVIATQMARLGVEYDYSKKLKKGIRLAKVYRKSKLAKPYGIKAGDILLSIDGTSIDRNTDLLSLLTNKTGEKIELEFKTKDGIKKAEILGMSYYPNATLKYDNWVSERENKTNRLSDGKIGYLHIRSMNQASLDKFKRDLFTKCFDKEALIIDVRDNGGGRTHDDILEILTKKAYGIETKRTYTKGELKTPGRTFEKPIVVLINENSFSDAEIFPNIFKYLKLGKVIGIPTSGGVIGTTPFTLMDGYSMRMPRNGWFRADGSNMEGDGAKPNIVVEQTLEQRIEDDDVQLKRAVKELLKEID